MSQNPDPTDVSTIDEEVPVTARARWHPEGHDPLDYEISARRVLVRDDDDRPLAQVFCLAYTATGPTVPAERPVTFLFNGGPGSASLWLNTGGFGPRRAPTRTPSATPPAPYDVVDNPHSLLPLSDLVFVDAVGTGFSRACPGVPTGRVWGVDQDVDVFSRVVHRYLELTGAWNRPRFLFGESYGTMRAAALALHLQNRCLDLNGVVLLSTVLDEGGTTGDLGHVHRLPTLTATAHHHGLLPPTQDLSALLEEAREFAMGGYATALLRGDRTTAAQQEAVARRTAELTGLDVGLLQRRHLRVGMEEFRYTLRAADRLVVGRFDTRFTAPAAFLPSGTAVDPATDDAATAGVNSAHLSTFREHLHHDVGYRGPVPYRPLHNTVIEPAWDWRHRPPGGGAPVAPTDVSADLGAALRRNPSLQVAVMGGLYDLATPFFGAESDIARLHLDGQTRDRVRFHWYASGHMTFVDENALARMRTDLESFYRDALAR